MSQIGKFLRLPFSDKFLILETVTLLGFARFLVLALPFKQVAKLLFTNQDLSRIDSEIKSSPDPKVIRVAWAVRRMSSYTPWKSNCLAKVIAGYFMLKRRRISSSIYFGMTKNNKGEFAAHAWLSSNGKIITGGSNLQRYSVVATFTN